MTQLVKLAQSEERAKQKTMHAERDYQFMLMKNTFSASLDFAPWFSIDSVSSSFWMSSSLQVKEIIINSQTLTFMFKSLRAVRLIKLINSFSPHGCIKLSAVKQLITSKIKVCLHIHMHVCVFYIYIINIHSTHTYHVNKNFYFGCD